VEHDLGIRRFLAVGWVERLRRKVAPLPGARVVRGYRVVGWVLTILSAVAGAGAASAALAYDGGTPVNVFGFMAVFVLLQALLLVLMVCLMSVRRALGASLAVGWVQGLVVWASRTRWVDRVLKTPDDGPPELRAGAGVRLYGDVERWLLFSMAQRLGVVFNGAALVTSLALVSFTDLEFSWSTTLDTDAEDVRAVLDVVATPWSWCVSHAVPSPEVIEQSQWVRRGGGRFVGDGADPDEVRRWAGQWWRFLVAALICWGLLPRVVAYSLGRWRVQRSLATTSLDHAAFQRLYERLLPPTAGWTGPDPDQVRASTRGRRKGRAGRREAAAPPVSSAVGLVTWGRLAEGVAGLPDVVQRRFDRVVEPVVVAGGPDLDADDDAIRVLAEAGVTMVVVAVEVGVQPTREIFSFLRELRDGLGARAQLVVSLVRRDGDRWAGPDQAEGDAWAARVADEGDPYLRIDEVTA